MIAYIFERGSEYSTPNTQRLLLLVTLHEDIYEVCEAIKRIVAQKLPDGDPHVIHSEAVGSWRGARLFEVTVDIVVKELPGAANAAYELDDRSRKLGLRPLAVREGRVVATEFSSGSVDLPQLFQYAPKLVERMLMVREDAHMALTGQWDRSDDGFRAILDGVEDTLKSAGLRNLPALGDSGAEASPAA